MTMQLITVGCACS